MQHSGVGVAACVAGPAHHFRLVSTIIRFPPPFRFFETYTYFMLAVKEYSVFFYACRSLLCNSDTCACWRLVVTHSCWPGLSLRLSLPPRPRVAAKPARQPLVHTMSPKTTHARGTALAHHRYAAPRPSPSTRPSPRVASSVAGHGWVAGERGCCTRCTEGRLRGCLGVALMPGAGMAFFVLDS